VVGGCRGGETGEGQRPRTCSADPEHVLLRAATGFGLLTAATAAAAATTSTISMLWNLFFEGGFGLELGGLSLLQLGAYISKLPTQQCRVLVGAVDFALQLCVDAYDRKCSVRRERESVCVCVCMCVCVCVCVSVCVCVCERERERE